MKKNKLLILLISLISLLFITSCNSNKVLKKVKEVCSNYEVVSISSVIDSYEGEIVSVCGIITAKESDKDFFIQDADTGIYINGYHYKNSSVTSNLKVGNIVLITGKRDTYLEQPQISYVSKIQIVDNNTELPEPIEVYDFTDIEKYEGLLIKLINVNAINYTNFTEIRDQSKLTITRLYSKLKYSQSNIDLIGVLYHRTNRPTAFVATKVESTQIVSNRKRIDDVRKILEVPEVYYIKRKLPTNINEVEISWSSNSDIICINNGLISFTENIDKVSVKLTAKLTYKNQIREKDFNVKVINMPYYELPTNYEYDGPLFPTNSLSKSFWYKGGGSVKATLNRCNDGDTATFYIDGESYTTRFYNVDTEEMYNPDFGAEEWGKPASVYTCNILQNAKEIYLQSDPNNNSMYDEHGRLLAWFWVDGELLQYHIISNGLGKVAYLSFGANMYTSILLEAEEKAKANGIGRWGNYLDPYWDYGKKKLKD